ncbi:monovalent cation/H+ antiporter complex subunit F [Candidatus Leptofilum sp.]|uniref:monovalent cation/H+ antiporter complex subunit F n=1 Tax=Candidatus Leptofilum sp. TaxID=3241576 RepID=UPI003B5A2AB2
MNLLIGYTGLTFLMITVALAFWRMRQGPSLPDRVVALDLLMTVGIAVTAVYAMIMNEPLIMDVATVLALISFLGTIAFAYYVDLRE